MMDSGLCPGNYFDYPDDEVALQREFEIGDSLTGIWEDETFPPNARSLYFDPLNPPKGSIPNESIKWNSIAEGDIVDCENPVVFCADNNSALIRQGAVGNSYFVNALRMLSCHPRFISRIIVSDKFANLGLYTIKFYKCGRWRYVHIDDRIPCRQSGRVHFCRNVNPNETFAMLIEKAYAKLHGCYEAIAYGMIDKAIHDLTPAAGVQALRLEKMKQSSLCDDIWEKIEKSIADNRLIGCGRFVADPYAENPSKRCGITLGHTYQVIDICTCFAEPTEDLDSITVGMICVRNLQRNSGRFNGRWSFGDQLWVDYKEIAFDLRHRTREIQYKRGLGPNPNEGDEYDAHGMKISKHFPEDVDEDDEDEPDTLDVRYMDKQRTIKIVQPMAEDLHWIQIEDFVEIFNRMYITVDLSFDKRAVMKSYPSKWIAGDYLCGSGGPPFVVTSEVETVEEFPEGDEDADPVMKEVVRKIASINENFTDNPMYPFSVHEPCSLSISLYQPDKRWNVGRLGEDPRQVLSLPFASRGERLRACMEYPVGIGFLVMKLNGLKWRVTEFRLKKVLECSDGVQFSNIVNNAVTLRPGRYAIVPYTHCELDRSMDYLLHIQYLKGTLDFEVENVITQRLCDNEPSVDNDEDADQDDNELLRVSEKKGEGSEGGEEDEKAGDDVSVMSFEKVLVDGGDEGSMDEASLESAARMKMNAMEKVNPPKLKLFKQWEYSEDTEEMGLSQVFTEVGDLMKYMRNLKGEVRKLHGTIRAVTGDNNSVAEESKVGGAGRRNIINTNKSPYPRGCKETVQKRIFNMMTE